MTTLIVQKLSGKIYIIGIIAVFLISYAVSIPVRQINKATYILASFLTPSSCIAILIVKLKNS